MASALDGARSIQRIEQRANRSAWQSTALDAPETRGERHHSRPPLNLRIGTDTCVQ